MHSNYMQDDASPSWPLLKTLQKNELQIIHSYQKKKITSNSIDINFKSGMDFILIKMSEDLHRS
jgi:hypothetical protein